MTPAIGSKWQDNDPRSEGKRIVEVLAIEGDRAVIRTMGMTHTTKSALKNFGVKHQRGFSAVEEKK